MRSAPVTQGNCLSAVSPFYSCFVRSVKKIDSTIVRYCRASFFDAFHCFCFFSVYLLPVTQKEKVTGGKYKSVKYEDFVCQKVTKVQIRQSENDIGAVYPDTEITENDNSYILQDNFLVYGMGADALETVARNLYEVIKVVKYRPYNCEKIGNPCLSLGEAVNVYTAKEIIESYVLSRTYKGIQQPTDTISASGKSPKYSEQVNGINKSIIQLRGKTNELERTVEETRSEIKDVESGLDTKITQTAGKIELEAKRAIDAEVELAAAISVQADQIKLKVSKGDVSSQLSIESGQVSISGNRFVLDSTNFSITADGKVTAKSIDITGGTINLQSASQDYSTIVLKYGSYTCGMDGAGVRATYSSNSTTLTASGIVTTGSVNAPQGYFDTISPKTSRGTIAFRLFIKPALLVLHLTANHFRNILTVSLNSVTLQKQFTLQDFTAF